MCRRGRQQAQFVTARRKTHIVSSLQVPPLLSRTSSFPTDFPQVAKDVDPAQVVAMAAANPQLMPRLLISVTQPGPVQVQQQVQPPGKGAKGKGGRKRARA